MHARSLNISITHDNISANVTNLLWQSSMHKNKIKNSKARKYNLISYLNHSRAVIIKSCINYYTRNMKLLSIVEIYRKFWLSKNCLEELFVIDKVFIETFSIENVCYRYIFYIENFCYWYIFIQKIFVIDTFFI